MGTRKFKKQNQMFYVLQFVFYTIQICVNVSKLSHRLLFLDLWNEDIKQLMIISWETIASPTKDLTYENEKLKGLHHEFWFSVFFFQ